jgi:hypothetical protein
MEKRFCWLNPKLEVRDTAQCGKGNFAIRDIDKGELLMIHGGWIMTRAEETALPEPYNDYGLPITEDLVLYSREDDTFINHSCDPNAGYKGQIFLVAMRDIEAGDEICIDYATILHASEGVKPYRLKCFCGSENCRDVITDEDWKLPELQRKYDSYFQLFLQEKLDAMKVMK